MQIISRRMLRLVNVLYNIPMKKSLWFNCIVCRAKRTFKYRIKFSGRHPPVTHLCHDATFVSTKRAIYGKPVAELQSVTCHMGSHTRHIDERAPP